MVLGPEISVITTPRAAGIREDQDALLIIHEGGSLRQVGGTGTAFHDEPRGMTLALPDNPARAARYLGHKIGAEALDDLVERARHGWQRGEPLDQRIAPTGGLAALDRWPSRTTGRDDRLPSLSVKGS